MTEIRIAEDGAPHDNVGHDLASSEDLAKYDKAADELKQFRAPVLIHADNPHEKLFVVSFDGTGNNKFTKPEYATNVAKISDQIESINQFGREQVLGHYVVGPGTQSSRLTSLHDNLRGFTYESNINDAYKALVDQANTWIKDDPHAAIRVHSMGFSRGASQVPGFARLLHDEGIPDLASQVRSADGSVGYSRYLVEPGKTIQTVALFDPVATGTPMLFDRRLPPSVVSGLQITSTDELRASFPSDRIISPGLSQDGRFLNVMVPGAHSDVGGGYLRDGLSVRSGNLMRDYCNALSDTPFLKKEFEPKDPRWNVIHRSTEGNYLFRSDPRVGVRGQASGTNEILVPRHVESSGPVIHAPEPVNPQLEAGLTRRSVDIGAQNMVPSRPPIPPASAEAIEAASRSVPFAPKVLGAVGTIPLVLDGVHTIKRQAELEAVGNLTGADSVVRHFGAANTAGLTGAETFMAAGAALGVESGPGMFVTGAIGAGVGYLAGDKIADAYENHLVTHQQDAQGNTWRLNDQQAWTRDETVLGISTGQTHVADPALADRLSFQSTNTSVELALARPQIPRDPYKQPADPGESPSVREAPWTRDTQTHQWSRQVVDGLLEHGMVSSHLEKASPQRAAELEQGAARTILQNAADSPLGIAKHYQSVYEKNDWARHGPMPEAVTHALSAPIDKVVASDGHAYSHEKDGTWSRPGMIYGTNPADTRMREELDLSERALGNLKASTDRTAHGQQTSAPAAPSRLDDPRHPDNALFNQVRGYVVDLDKSLGRTPDQHTDNISSALTVQARADGLQRVDQVALSTDGNKIWAVQTPPGRKDHLFDQRTSVPTAEANTPMEKSAEKWPDAMQQFHAHAQEQAMSQQRVQDRQQAESQTANGPSMAR